MNKNMVNFSLEMSQDIANELEEMSRISNTTMGNIFLKSLFLMHVAIKSKEKGNELAVVNKDGIKVGDINYD